MSEKKITLNLGGKHDFVVTKSFVDDVERFTISQGTTNYGDRRVLAEGPWIEASAALSGFRDEADAAAEALVQIATLTASGGQEDDDVVYRGK